ncbi:unnamed protein product, partial [Ceratitis capitata]
VFESSSWGKRYRGCARVVTVVVVKRWVGDEVSKTPSDGGKLRRALESPSQSTSAAMRNPLAGDECFNINPTLS